VSGPEYTYLLRPRYPVDGSSSDFIRLSKDQGYPCYLSSCYLPFIPFFAVAVMQNTLLLCSPYFFTTASLLPAVNGASSDPVSPICTDDTPPSSVEG